MVIDGVNGPREVNPLEGIKGPSVEKSKEKKKSEQGDRIELRHTWSVEELTKEAKNISSIREELVEELRKAIESGNYFVDTERLARKILEELSE
ncbi:MULTISPECIES: flagellar biosynthesis anti-sigma factor FlgM [Thermotoga]|jgi:negative regulator of flagellin synthesis FlgM|nr:MULTISPECIES: flagellar biosynthesis anti-sigma factor FlgM [Thermotoga]KFZ22403.1 Anti-sigma-28 factor, FlgM [Thermotoga neapolitana LA10]MDK2785930.1 negative regulator of flagellin synthesis FlgM [Thermotoga sp.]HBF11706.1 flagellar biosynthesis anti-sigma factor FlgM [Thermotoga neapolitana]